MYILDHSIIYIVSEESYFYIFLLYIYIYIYTRTYIQTLLYEVSMIFF